MPEQLNPNDAAELERLGLIRYVGSDDDAFSFELTDAGRRYAPILARLAMPKVSTGWDSQSCFRVGG
jgi:hypothetical protein